MNTIRLKYLCSSFSTPLSQQEVLESGPYKVFGASGLVGYLNNYGLDKQYLGIIKDGAGVGRIKTYEEYTSLLGTMAYIIPNSGVDINWLKYVIMALDLGKNVGKTTIPHIYFTDYGNRRVAHIPISEQKQIADFLDYKCSQIDTVIEKTKATIEEYQKLKQSVITEAATKGIRDNRAMKDSGIEWIGNIPLEWDCIKIGRLFTLRNEKNTLPEDQVQLLSLYTGIGVFPQGEHYTASGNHAQTVEGYKIVKKNDIVVNIILAWMGAMGVSDYDGVTSPAYDVYIPNLKMVVPRFYHYVFRTTGMAEECYKYGRGIMMMRWRTYSTEFKQISVPFPSLKEQQAIADYLDSKCAEIDKLIADKTHLLEEMESYKKSVIYEYVTGKKQVQ